MKHSRSAQVWRILLQECFSVSGNVHMLRDICSGIAPGRNCFRSVLMCLEMHSCSEMVIIQMPVNSWKISMAMGGYVSLG
jgi:hypothetical protein